MASASGAAETQAAVPGPFAFDRPGGSLARLDLLRLSRVLYRRWPAVAKTAAATLALAIVYLVLAPARYTAEFMILVDPREVEVLKADPAAADRLVDSGLIDSQVEILKSDGVLLQVARNLDLAGDPEFTGPHGVAGWAIFNVKAMLASWLPQGAEPPETQLEKELATVAILGRDMKVKRVGLTHVIQVDYRGYDAGKAAKIAAAIADAYRLGELDARYKAAETAGSWLRQRIREVAEQASEADSAVQNYKAEHDIVDTSRGLITEQRLADVNSQLAAASAATSEAKARLDRILEIEDSPLENAAVADALHSDVVNRLRAQYLDLEAREADYAARFGGDHAAVATIHGQKVQVQGAARDELHRIAQSTRSDYAIALAREQSLKSSLQALIDAAARSNQAQGELRNLESAAQSYRDLYETMLRKAEEASREQSFPIASDRLITPPSAPREPSWPKPLIVIGGGAALGLFLGAGLALAGEALGNTFRTPDDVRDYAGLECLGILPLVRLSRATRRTAARADPQFETSAPSPSHAPLAAPVARFSRTVRDVKVSIDLTRPLESGAVIGIVSAIPGEGKTMFGSYLALLCARTGAKTVLLDADMHRGALSKAFAPDAAAGLLDVLEGRARLDEVVREDPATRLDFIPRAAPTRPPDLTVGLPPAAMAGVLTQLRARYDYVVIDLPPLLPVADVKGIAALADGFVLIVEWGRTSRDAVRDSLAAAGEVHRRIVGVVLNKAEPRALHRMETCEGFDRSAFHASERSR
jgi:succinoglycan biosynthesis transport protein ExoP